MRLIGPEEIERALARIDLLPAIEAGFVAYSEGRAVVPPVGELLFEDPPGEVHIKYGYLEGGDVYVVKVASGFYENPRRGLPSGDGLMLLFEQSTGRPLAVLLDHARLTDVRTAVAGAVAARALAPRQVERIGVVGCGVQARLQVEELRRVVECRRVLVWGRRREALESYRREIEASGFEVAVTSDVGEIGPACQLIVTATPSKVPLLRAEDVAPGTHVTAVGADTVGKQELEAALLGRADIVVADSLAQCRERGEIAAALAAGEIDENDVVELGDLLAGRRAGRAGGAEGDRQISVADLTGVAVQDLAAARAVLEAVAAEAPRDAEGETSDA